MPLVCWIIIAIGAAVSLVFFVHSLSGILVPLIAGAGVLLAALFIYSALKH